MLKRIAVFASFLCAFGDPALAADSPPPSGHYLFAWTGDADKRGNDFLVVIDADPASATYGQLVTTLATDQQTVRIHHTEYVMPASGMLAVDALAYAGFTLNYKFGFSTEHYPYPPNVPLLEITPLWDPMLTLAAGLALLLAAILMLRRKRVAVEAVVASVFVLLLMFAVRLSRPESRVLSSLSTVYQRSPFAMIWPIVGLAITVLVCLALWQDRQRSPDRSE